MVREIALDLNDRPILDLAKLELPRYESLSHNLESTLGKKDLQIGLLQKPNDMLDTQFKAQRTKNPEDTIFSWLLRMISAFGIGYFLGKL